MAGLEGVSALRCLSPLTQIILLSHAPDDREAIQALKMGVKGYCHSNIDPRLLVRAVKLVRQGEIWVGRKVIPNLIEEIAAARQGRQKESIHPQMFRLDSLTPRELQIARLIGDGSCNKEIADRLKISESTVKAHLTAIYRKLKIDDRLRLALLVTESARIHT